MINCFINLEEVVVFVGGVPVDDLIEVREVPVQVHAVRIVPSDQVVVVALRDIHNTSTFTAEIKGPGFKLLSAISIKNIDFYPEFHENTC
jgi:hypothetical protein